MSDDDWVRNVKLRMRAFARQHGTVYAKKERQISASFEIGCFHALLDFYEQHFTVKPEGLQDGEYRYLTTPAGNPERFSFVRLMRKSGAYILRQQVRVRSAIDPDIQFTPDFVVFREGVKIRHEIDEDYANGKKRLFYVRGEDLVAAHECKSMNPFPELIISFLGMLVASHPWANERGAKKRIVKDGKHLAPSLFVGGTARGLHQRMVDAVGRNYPVNIILGMHYGTWRLFGDGAKLNLIDDPRTNETVTAPFGYCPRRIISPTSR
jgi:hypothetical protein